VFIITLTIVDVRLTMDEPGSARHDEPRVRSLRKTAYTVPIHYTGDRESLIVNRKYRRTGNVEHLDAWVYHTIKVSDLALRTVSGSWHRREVRVPCYSHRCSAARARQIAGRVNLGTGGFWMIGSLRR